MSRIVNPAVEFIFDVAIEVRNIISTLLCVIFTIFWLVVLFGAAILLNWFVLVEALGLDWGSAVLSGCGMYVVGILIGVAGAYSFSDACKKCSGAKVKMQLVLDWRCGILVGVAVGVGLCLHGHVQDSILNLAIRGLKMIYF